VLVGAVAALVFVRPRMAAWQRPGGTPATTSAAAPQADPESVPQP